MRLWVVSDLHMEKRRLLPLTQIPDFDVLVCAGDIFDGNPAYSMSVVRSLAGDRPAVFVAGNHEYRHFKTVNDAISAARDAAECTGVHYLERDAAQIAGVTFAGATLWEQPDHATITFLLQTRDDVLFLSRIRADVIITHFPPSSDVFARVQAPLWICGHEHGHADLSIGDRRMVRNALGYPGEEALGFQQGFVVEV